MPTVSLSPCHPRTLPHAARRSRVAGERASAHPDLGDSTVDNANRREFLTRAAAGVALSGAALSAANWARAAGAGERLVFGLIGCGGRGTHDAQSALNVPGVEIGWLA